MCNVSDLLETITIYRMIDDQYGFELFLNDLLS